MYTEQYIQYSDMLMLVAIGTLKAFVCCNVFSVILMNQIIQLHAMYFLLK